MKLSDSRSRPFWRLNVLTLRIAAIVTTVLLLLSLIAILSKDVSARLEALRQASADNSQWTMNQIEVETLRLRLSMDEAAHNPEMRTKIEDFRLWFDILYSRLNLFEQSALYTTYVSRQEMARRAGRMRDIMNGWIPVIDGSDTALVAALPAMRSESEELETLARDIALSGLQDIAKAGDISRTEISDTLIRLAIASIATFFLLAILSIMFARLYRHSVKQSEENQITGARLQMIIQSSPDAIVVTNRGGWTVEFNPAAEAMFNCTRETIIGQKTVPKIFRREHVNQYQQIISEAIERAAQRGPQRFELEGMRADGSTFPLELSIAAKEIRQGSLIIGFMRDISARKAADAALQEALVKARAGEKAKADFLAVMSHEMRTPLNGLIGSMELLQDTELTTEQASLVDVMEKSGRILLGHVNSVLDIARAEAGEIKVQDHVFDVDDVIAECIANQSSLAQKNGSRIVSRPLTGPLAKVKGDAARTRQILLNLIGNAVKFTHNGTITIETERLDPKTVRGKPGIVEFRIIDTGVGIAADDLSRIFEDFEVVEATDMKRVGGTGLGLGIVRRLTRALGGEIGVESEPGEGSVFWVRLPLWPADGQPAADRSALSLPAAPSEKPAKQAVTPLNLLIIEDNDINRMLLRTMLEKLGHKVTEAQDGLEGIALADKQRFDTILTDISMPKLDGVEVTKYIRNGSGPSANSRIIALTAHALPDDVARFIDAGMNACLTKPINRSTLMAQLSSSITLPIEQEHADELPLLDRASLTELHEELGADVVQSLINRLIKEAAEKIATLSAFTAAPDDLARAAHQLAGGSATFGAKRLRHVLSEVETYIKLGEIDAARSVASGLQSIWDSTEELLKSELAQPSA